MVEDLWISYRFDTKALKKLEEEKERGLRIGGFDGRGKTASSTKWGNTINGMV